jgi:hypothetical protein
MAVFFVLEGVDVVIFAMHQMKRYLLLLVLLSFTLSVYSQQITFQKTYGGTGNDYGKSFQQTSDGGYIITGTTNSFGAGYSDVYLIKIDSNGDTLWTKTFGGPGFDEGNSVRQTTDGGYIITGYTSFGSGSDDVYLIKTDINGNSLWTKTFGITGTNVERGLSVHQTTDGGYIIAGSTDSFGAGDLDAYIIRTDANGDLLWTKTFGGIFYDDIGSSVQQTTDGGYIISGTGNGDVYLIKTDTNGDTLWTKTFGGPDSDGGGTIQQTSDGGYIIAGYTYSFGAGDKDAYLIKTDSNGDLLWSKTFGGTNSDGSVSIKQTSDDGYIIAGYTVSFSSGYDDVYLIKTDASGDTLWTKTFGGTSYDNAASVQQTTDGGYMLTGQTWSFGAGIGDVYLIKTDSLGNSGCNEGNPATIVTSPAAQVTSPATIVYSPATIETTPVTIVGSGGTVTTLCTTVGIQSAIINPKSGIAVSPNPFTSELAVQSSEKINQIIIYDLMGATVYQTELPSNNASAELNLSFLHQGIYFLNVKSKGESWTKKIVKM